MHWKYPDEVHLPTSIKIKKHKMMIQLGNKVMQAPSMDDRLLTNRADQCIHE